MLTFQSSIGYELRSLNEEECMFVLASTDDNNKMHDATER